MFGFGCRGLIAFSHHTLPYLTDCMVNVHENSCKDQISYCMKARRHSRVTRNMSTSLPGKTPATTCCSACFGEGGGGVIELHCCERRYCIPVWVCVCVKFSNYSCILARCKMY